MAKGWTKEAGLTPWSEIAAALGVSHQRAVQIAQRAMTKLRRELERRGLDRDDVRGLLAALDSSSGLWDELGDG